MRKVLVTGACGFIGSHLVEALAGCTYRVRALVQYNPTNSWGWMDHSSVKNDVEVVMGDVRDPFQMQKVTQGMETVFNLAALIGIPYSYQSPESYIQTNTIGTLNLLQASRSAGVKRFVHVSSSEVYGTARTVPIKEDHPLNAQSPYAASKIAADQLAHSFYCSYDFPVVIARPFNTYGPRQSARAVIPTIMAQIANGQTKIKLGNTTTTRDFTYVTDTVMGIMGAGWCRNGLGAAINLGTGHEVSIYDLAKLIGEVAGVAVEIETEDSRVRPEHSEVERLVSDYYLARMCMGYAPEYREREGLMFGLKKTWEWFKENKHLYKQGYVQ